MKNYFQKIIPFAFIFIFVFGVSGLVAPHIAHATPCTSTDAKSGLPAPFGCDPKEVWSIPTTPVVTAAASAPGPSWWDTISCSISPTNAFNCALRNAAAMAGEVALTFTSTFLRMSGQLLNAVVFHTIVNAAESYKNLAAISEGWKVIRDVSNMAFIFVLLYAAIQTILGVGKDTKGLIVRVVVVAILINFSLFFTQFVIDLSNVLSLTFYDAIVPGAAIKGQFSFGLSDAFMQNLTLQTLYSVKGQPLTFLGIVTTGIMGSIMLLIASFVFFAVALMFIIRYVVLILVIILSPIAFIAYILPEAEKYRKQWVDALVGQAFFAPIYFMLTWVTIKILAGMNAKEVFGKVGPLSAVGDSVGFVPAFTNYCVVIVFLIVSLVVAKDFAGRTPGGVGKLTSWATGKAGAATFGIAGRLGKNSIGRAGQFLADNDTLKKYAARSGGDGMAARLIMATGKKAGGASFDARGLGLSSPLGAGKPAGKGGYAEYRKKKAEDATKFATSLAPSENTKGRARADYEEAKKKFGQNSAEATSARVQLDQLEGVKKEEMEKREKKEIKDDPIVNKVAEVNEEIKKKEVEIASTEVSDLKAQKELELEAIKQRLISATETARIRTEAIKSSYRDEDGEIKPIKDAGEIRKAAYAQVVEDSAWAKFRGYNYEAAGKIRKGKSTKDQAAELVKKMQEEAGGNEPKEEPEKDKGGEEEKKIT
jgi:hypothetical protein